MQVRMGSGHETTGMHSTLVHWYNTQRSGVMRGTDMCPHPQPRESDFSNVFLHYYCCIKDSKLTSGAQNFIHISSLLRCQIALHLRAWSNTFCARTRIPTCTCTGTLITFDPTSPEILYPPLGPVALADSVCAVLGRYKEWQNQWWR